MRYFIIVMALSFMAGACSVEKENVKRPNIILMIGDGMGVAQVTAAYYWNPKSSNFSRFKTVGLMETSSTSHKVTDSASGATAFSIGQKTHKRAIGVDSLDRPVKTILEELRDSGYQTGLISLTSITHATPASFYAHVPDRDMHEAIAADMVQSDVDFFAGGGWQYFRERKDSLDLIETLVNKGYEIDSTRFPDVLDKEKKYGFFMAKESLPSKVDGRTDFLQNAAQVALDYFEQNDAPYFLMIEGSYIDWGGHAENAEMVITEAVDFDQTIGRVLDKTATSSNTLVVVTADHETGGVSVGKYYEENKKGWKKVEVADTLAVNFNTNQHTAALVPVFAKGYGAEIFGGVYSNDKIYHKLKSITELSDGKIMP